MKFEIKKTYLAVIIIFIWICWFVIQACLIRYEYSEMSWYAYRLFVLMAIASLLVSGLLLYVSEYKGLIKWLSAGVLAPFLIDSIFKAFGWYLNFEIVLHELTDDFDICGFVMMFTIPMSMYMKCRLEEK